MFTLTKERTQYQDIPLVGNIYNKEKAQCQDKRNKIQKTNNAKAIAKIEQDLNANAKCMIFIIPRFIANNHAFLQGCQISKSKTNTLRAFMNI